MYNQTNKFVYLGGNVNHNADLSIEVNRSIRNAWCSSRKYTLELYDRSSAALKLKTRMLRAKVLKTMMYGCVTYSPRRTDYPISCLDTLIKTGSESIKPLNAGGGSCSRDLWRVWRTGDCRSV